MHIALERDEGRIWTLTDPIEYPADAAAALRLMEHVRSRIGDLVPEEELAFAESTRGPSENTQFRPIARGRFSDPLLPLRADCCQ